MTFHRKRFHIRFFKINGFIRIHDRIRYLISLKSDITYIFLAIYDSLPIEK